MTVKQLQMLLQASLLLEAAASNRSSSLQLVRPQQMLHSSQMQLQQAT
jgi:hypothetical protein